jgi:hypothetical protein
MNKPAPTWETDDQQSASHSDSVVTRRGNQEFEGKKAMPAARTPVPVMTYKHAVDCCSKPPHLDRGQEKIAVTNIFVRCVIHVHIKFSISHYANPNNAIPFCTQCLHSECLVLIWSQIAKTIRNTISPFDVPSQRAHDFDSQLLHCFPEAHLTTLAHVQ